MFVKSAPDKQPHANVIVVDSYFYYNENTEYM